ncbi:MAG: hypothetical protein PHX09_00875 [Clostridia bacterium]|nr:hypothetical protein [Clostridia bacterium]MDD4685833.1 hypothetical protein [Clostridia bacterium]
MKKIFLSILVCMLCFTTACGCSTNEYWSETKLEVSEFLNSFEYEDLINGNLSYSSSIDSKINSSDQEYNVLNAYSNILSSCFVTAKNFIYAFEYTPVNIKAAGQYYNALTQNINQFKLHATIFLNAKNDYVQAVYQTDLNNAIALSKLKVYKKEFYNFILTANEFNKTFSQALIRVYGNFTEISEDVSNSAKAVATSFSELTDLYITYALKEYGGIHSAYTFFYYDLINLKNNINSAYLNNSAFNNWLTFYETFQVEKNTFLHSLNQIDLTALNITNLTSIVYLGKVNRFVDTNASLFINKTLSLL